MLLLLMISINKLKILNKHDLKSHQQAWRWTLSPITPKLKPEINNLIYTYLIQKILNRFRSDRLKEQEIKQNTDIRHKFWNFQENVPGKFLLLMVGER